MARSFNGNTANFINAGNQSALRITTSVSLFCWLYLTTTSVSQALIFQDNGFGSFNAGYSLSLTSANHLFIQMGNGSSFGANFGGTFTFSGNTWYAAGFVFNSGASNGQFYVNGATDGALTTITGPSYNGTTTEGLSLGIINSLSAGQSQPLNGRLADCAVWNTPLTALEMLGLARGQRPYTVREKSLVGYWPLDGLASPEPDLSGNAFNGTINGSVPFAFGAPTTLFTPRWPMGSLLVPPPPPVFVLMPQTVT